MCCYSERLLLGALRRSGMSWRPARTSESQASDDSICSSLGALDPSTGLDLNVVLLDFGARYVFRSGGEVQENWRSRTKNKTKTTRKTPLRSGPAV